MPKIILTKSIYNVRITGETGGNKMIKIQNTVLASAVKSLDFSNQMRVNSKYAEFIEHIGEENTEKIERLLSAYVWDYLLNDIFIIEALTSSKHFLNKVSSMTDAQIERYIDLCTKAQLGVLLGNKILLRKYSTDDHLRICELHIAYHENPTLASAIELAAKHKARFLYIKKIAEIVCNPEKQDKYANDLLLKEEFYTIKSDFERLIILEHIIKSDNEYEKSLYKYLASNESFTTSNDIYYLIDLVEKLLKLDNEQLSTQLIAEINDTPSITQIYSPGDLCVIMNRINAIPRLKDFFFNPFILANFNAKNIETIYNMALSENSEAIELLIVKLQQYKAANLDIIETLKQRMSINQTMRNLHMDNNEEPSNPPVFLSYKPSSSEQ